ncbi:hypothetical protein SOP93_26215 [Peribacillus frigoritolerans]|uniref:hypothetical protein n=1 Tax=Peribacillus frigoritolerans TaxID=450367 RepID=UPI002B24EF0D|nr:hypothetical protein [Peribacillus frigoritolerans]MEB2494581.1 hypothetical protein [Peribacillus frigoritolerans]
MKKLYLIHISILLAAPLSSFLSASIDSLISLNENLPKDEYSPFLNGIIVGILYELAIYCIIGIPVTLIIDTITYFVGLHTNLKVYLLQFSLYTISAITLAYILDSDNFWAYLMVGIAVHTYFHILFFLKKIIAILKQNLLRNIGQLFLYD